MLQLRKVALVSFSTAVTPIDFEKNDHNRRRRIWFLLLHFKAKHRARLRWSADKVDRSTSTSRQKAFPSTYNELDTFHRASKTIIFFSQFFGVLPVANIRVANPKELNFRLTSWPILNTAAFLIFGGLKALHFTFGLLKTGINAKNIVGIVFFYSNLTSCVRLIFLAKTWPKLLRQWTRVEMIFLKPPYKPASKRSLKWKLQSLASSFAVIALIEHCMYYSSGYYNFRMVAIQCRPNGTDQASFRQFIVENQDIFQYFSYHFLWACYAIFLNGTFTFIWNFVDILIMLVSLSVSVRFQQLAGRMRSLEGQSISENRWHEMRQHHIQLCELMTYIDSTFSDLVLISCLNNMYFICNQLLNIFTKLRWPINYIYFWFSLLFLIGRTASVFMFGTKIYDAGLLPLRSLYLVPSGCWSVEVQRFYAQIKDECIALTGKRFFNVTRTSLFGMIATIITYEFMLLQFDAKNWKKGLEPLCE